MSVQKLNFTSVKQAKKGFTTLLNEVVQNITDGFVLGVYTYLSTLPPAWSINRVQLGDHFGVGRDKINKALSWLNEHYLIEYKQDIDDKGHFLASYIEVQDGFEFIENFNKNQTRSTATLKTRATDNPVTGKSAPINTISNINTKKDRVASKSKRPPAILLPDDFAFTVEEKEIASQHVLNIALEFKKFKTYYRDKRRTNWHKDFLLWLLRSADYKNANQRIKYANQQEVIRPKYRDYTQERLDREAKH